MLWRYAPLETMDRPGQSRCFRGTRRRGLQVDRCRRGGSLLRPIGTGRPKDLHGNQHYGINSGRSDRRTRGSRLPWNPESGSGAGLHRIFHNIACPRPDLLRRRGGGGPSDSRTGPQARSDHYLAPERQATRAGADQHPIRSAAPRPRHLHSCCNHHGPRQRRIAPATASLSSFANRRNWGPGSSTTSSFFEPSGRSVWLLSSN